MSIKPKISFKNKMIKMNASSKNMNKNSNTIFLVLMLLVVNLFIQTSFQKTNLKNENKSLDTEKSNVHIAKIPLGGKV